LTDLRLGDKEILCRGGAAEPTLGFDLRQAGLAHLSKAINMTSFYVKFHIRIETDPILWLFERLLHPVSHDSLSAPAPS
jgi:hypothetical protein